MRILVLFDVPVVEREELQDYQKFIRKLKKIGFYMLQYSIYVKAISNQSEFQRLYQKILSIITKKGNIIILRLTEKQYNDMIYLNGVQNKRETLVGNRNIVYFGEKIDESNDN